MRILVLSINYWPDATGIAAFNTWRCEYLASRGHEVTICTGPPYYPKWRVPDAYAGKLWQRETRNGVTILRSWMYVPLVVNTKKRILHEASFLASSALRAFGSRKPDLMFVVSPPLGLGITAVMLSRVWGVPYVFDVEDLQPDAAVELGMMKDGAVVRMLYRIEKMAYENAALVTTITEGMRERIAQKGIDPAKVVLFPPRADSSLYTLRQRTGGSAFREKYGLRGKLIVSHSGNMGVKQGLEVILAAAERSREREDIEYVFVGDGAMRRELEERARRGALKNVRFMPLLDDADFHEMLAATDIALITQQKVVSDIVFPSKTVTLLSAGCPVIASVNAESEVARTIVSSEAGLVVEPENTDALLDAIVQLASQPETRARMNSNATRFAMDTWDERITLPRMEEQFRECVQGKKSRVE